MKTIITILSLFITMTVQSQIKNVVIQASGLTCSMCNNAINKALKSVDYVSAVEVNIQKATFTVSFKPGAAVNFDQLKKKVEDAGFFVARFTANIAFDQQAITPDAHLNVGGMMMHFIDTKPTVLSGEVALLVEDKGYITAKQFKKRSATATMDCYKTGVAGACCSKMGLAAGTRIFHVRIS